MSPKSAPAVVFREADTAVTAPNPPRGTVPFEVIRQRRLDRAAVGEQPAPGQEPAAEILKPARQDEPAAAGRESAGERAIRLWTGNPEETAKLMLRELKANPEAIDVLVPWIADRVRALMRGHARDAESIVFPRGRSPEEQRRRAGRKPRTVRKATGKLPPVSTIRDLLAVPVLVPGKAMITWGQMTAADHDARIGMLRKGVNGTMRTIENHEWSKQQILKHKVACLNDIPEKTLEKELP